MDQPGVERQELARSLADLQWVNRWLGGSRVALAPVFGLLNSSKGTPLRVLDVATGSADIPLALARWGRRRGVSMQIVATDFHPGTLAIARAHAAEDPNVQVEEANALALHYPDASFDVAMIHTALHHFDPPEAIRVLRELNRVARMAVVVSDLVRSWSGLLGVRLMAATLWRRHPITRHDGPTSFRAAYTTREMVGMAREAGLRNLRLRRHRLSARMSLTAEPQAASVDARRA